MTGGTVTDYEAGCLYIDTVYKESFVEPKKKMIICCKS